MSIDNIVDLQITIESSAITQPGFGTPVILTQSEAIDLDEGTTQYFSSPAEFLAAFDELTDADQEYKDAVGIMSQNPHPLQFAVSRRSEPVAQVSTITVDTVPASPAGKIITITVVGADGQTRNSTVTLVGDATDDTVAEIAAKIKTQLDLQPADAGFTTGIASGVITLTATSAGIGFTLSKTGTGSASVTLATSTPNEGITADLPLAAANDVYAFLIPERDEATILTTAAAIQSDNKHVFYAQSNDSDIVATTYDDEDTHDVASELKRRGYTRTALFYHPTDSEALAASFAGKFLPYVPGSATGKFKTLSGVLPVAFTTTELNNLLSKSANSYRVVAGRAITFEGTMASGEYIDVIHGVDKLYSRIQALVFLALATPKKVPFTDAGIAAIGGAVITAIRESVADNLIAATRRREDGVVEPGFTVTIPRASEISPTDRAARRIPASNPIRFEATLAGAIHTVSVRGTVSV